MIIGIQDELLKINSLGLLERLLQDKTTKTNILWATDVYNELGAAYQRDKEIEANLITGSNSGIIKNRARKALEQQTERTRRHAEVFTPLWICRKMNDRADEVWFGHPNVFFDTDGTPTERVKFPKTRRKTPEWQRYVDSRRLEITCGEAPYLVSRYDVSTGEFIDIKNRIGVLDRKLRVVSENAADEAEWLKWTIRAYHTTYGYEFQGDNLLIARINLLMTFEEYLRARWNRKPTPKEYQTVANIIAWNIWQMDGLTGTIPYCKAETEYRQLTLFDWFAGEDTNEQTDRNSTQPRCRIYDWLGHKILDYLDINTGGRNMKFDYVIGNPPYQDETANEGDRKPPIYHLFMDESYKIAPVVELITPARFLFDAGQTPKAWNQKMLDDPHLQVLYYEPDAVKVFANTEIKGGIAVTLRDETKDGEAISVFAPFQELNDILKKVRMRSKNVLSLDAIIASQGLFRFSPKAFDDHPEISESSGKGTGSKIVSSVISKLPKVFTDTRGKDTDIKMLGRIDGKRGYKYIDRAYLIENNYIDAFKLFIPEANNSGKYGETLTLPIIGYPGEGSADTFLCGGILSSEDEAQNFIKYFKTKLFRALLGVKKATQHCPPSVWRTIPTQDFTPSSDINWLQSVADIDQQLYKKYGLSPEEIDFIETHVKEME